MHFYDWNIGDYAKKTQHLTNGEDLAYRRALDMYYDTEKPLDLTSGLPTLSRRLRVDIQDLENIIREFFPDGRNKHADEKISSYYAFLDRQKTNGKLGGRPKHKDFKPSGNPVVSGGVAVGYPVPSQPLTTNHLPEDKNIVPSKAVDACPHETIIGLYHQVLPTMPSVKVWTEKRRKLLQARWREDDKRQSLDYWERFFGYVAKSDFLCGRTEKPFNCDLEWMLNASNFVKIIEGKYHAG
jgi:hypothetical protein